MNLRQILRRTSLLLGLISIVLALWAGTHLQHILDDGGGRHVGEASVFIIVALLVFVGSRYGSTQTATS